MPSEEDACYICDGDRSTTRNPIIFCDGKGCNMPVHKVCYNVEEIPEDDWYCQRCENKKRKKATNIICCPMQTGAVKKTTVTGEYMHAVCAMWNKEIDHQVEPYEVNKYLLDKEMCYCCNQKKGLTIHCEEPNCNIHFHATCGINNSLITPASSVPANFIPKCSKHQTVWYTKKVHRRKRRLRRNDSDDDDEDSEEDDESEDGDEDEDEEAEEEDGGEDDDSENERKGRDKKKKPLIISSNNKGKTPLIPMKRRTSPQSLFPEDQQSSDDDMGTSSSSSKPKLNAFNNKPMGITTAIAASVMVPPSASITPSYKERLEAKRKKSALESRSSQPEDKKPLSITPPPAITSVASPIVTQKQKLPNRAHLTTNNNNNTVAGGSGIRLSGNTPSVGIKRYNVPGVIKDIDEIQNEIKAQRWNNGPTNNNTTTLQHPQPTTPHTTATLFFESEIARNNNNLLPGQRKPMDGWKPINGGEKEELLRLREENRRLNEFRRGVSEVLSSLNVPVPAGIQPDVDHVESYVGQLQSILRRVGPIREQERIQMQEYARGLTNNNHQ